MICDEMTLIKQDNMHVKFLALNAYFSSPRADPECLRRPAHASVKERHSSKKWLIYRHWRV